MITTLMVRLHAVLLLLLFAAAEQAEKQQQQQPPITLPGCPDRCGDTPIPFPFGTKPGCFRDGFEITCNDTFRPHRAFLALAGGASQHIAEIHYEVGWNYPVKRVDHANTGIELMEISVANGSVRAYGLVSSLCNVANLGDYVAKCQDIALGERSPFLLSVSRNVLVGVGWRVEPKLMSYLWSAHHNTTYEFSLACLSNLVGMPSLLQLATNGSCTSRGCCQAALPEAAPLTDFGMWFNFYNNTMWLTNPCSYAMLVETGWYNFSTPDMYGVEVLPRRYPRGVPFILDFSIRDKDGGGACPAEGHPPPPGYACVSGNSYCANTTGAAGASHGYVCRCLDHYDGNPYIANGCQDIDECKFRDKYPCSSDGICKNKLGGYDCPCKPGMKGDGETRPVLLSPPRGRREHRPRSRRPGASLLPPFCRRWPGPPGKAPVAPAAADLTFPGRMAGRSGALLPGGGAPSWTRGCSAAGVWSWRGRVAACGVAAASPISATGAVLTARASGELVPSSGGGHGGLPTQQRRGLGLHGLQVFAGVGGMDAASRRRS